MTVFPDGGSPSIIICFIEIGT